MLYQLSYFRIVWSGCWFVNSCKGKDFPRNGQTLPAIFLKINNERAESLARFMGFLTFASSRHQCAPSCVRLILPIIYMLNLQLLHTAAQLSPMVLLQGALVLTLVGSLIYLVYAHRKRRILDPRVDMNDLLFRTTQAIDNEASFIRNDLEEPSLVFHHQEMCYVISYDNERKRINFFMPQIHEATVGELSLIRGAINEVNQESCNEHLIYTCDEKKGSVFVHIQVCLERITNQEALTAVLRDEMERMARLNLRYFNQVRASHLLGQQFATDDCERLILERNFEKALLSKEEARHLRPRREHIADGRHRIRLREWLVRLCDGGLKAMVRLDIVTDEGLERIDEIKQIVNIDPLSILIERDEAGVAKVVRQQATLIVHCKNPSDKFDTEELLVVTLQVETQTDAAIYVRATICRTPVPGHGLETISDENIYMDNLSVTLAATIQPEDKRIAEIDYMWEELREAKRTGNLDDLTEELRYLVTYSEDRDMFEQMYWGRKLMLNKRYYEALLHLECVYEMLAPQFDDLKREARERFFDLCYQIGLCYNELRLYKEAYIYLDAVANCGNMSYTMAYVNCLVNSKDHRALQIVNSLLEQAQRYEEDSEESVPESAQEFHNFLRRNQVFILIETGKHADAQTILETMLGEPENFDFAVDELAYLKSLTEGDGPERNG